MEKELRISSFIIPVKVDENKYMLIHGYSGAMDIVDEESIKTLKSNCLDEIKNNFTQAQIQRFINRGYLTCKSIKEEQEYVRKISNVLIKRNKIFGRNNYTLLVTYNCI